MRSILKPCADHLRTFLNNNYNVQLKPTHAHELVASFFGYESKASMLADTLCPINNLSKAQIFVLMPSLFIDQRKKCFEDLPAGLPDTYTLGEEVFAFLEAIRKIGGIARTRWFWVVFDHSAYRNKT